MGGCCGNGSNNDEGEEEESPPATPPKKQAPRKTDRLHFGGDDNPPPRQQASPRKQGAESGRIQAYAPGSDGADPGLTSDTTGAAWQSPNGVQFTVGDQVRCRDTAGEEWNTGHVIEVIEGRPKIKCYESSNICSRRFWLEVEMEQSAGAPNPWGVNLSPRAASPRSKTPLQVGHNLTMTKQKQGTAGGMGGVYSPKKGAAAGGDGLGAPGIDNPFGTVGGGAAAGTEGDGDAELVIDDMGASMDIGTSS